MNTKKQVPPDVLDHEIYSNIDFPYLKLTFLALGMFFIGVLFNFSLKKSIENKVMLALSSDPSCPIQYSDLNVGLFVPKIKLSKVSLPGSCFQSRGGSIQLDSTIFSLSGPSFYPLGLKFDGVAFGDRLDLKSTLSLGFPSPMFKLHKSIIDMQIINALISKPNLLKGKIELEAQGKLQDFLVQEMNLVLKARQLSLPSQSISGLKLPTLNFGEAGGKFRLTDQNELNIDEFVLGNENSPIVGKLTGLVRLNQSNVQSSQLDLTALLKFAPEFVESFPILNFFLNKKEKTEDDFYKIQITGLLSSPNVQ